MENSVVRQRYARRPAAVARRRRTPQKTSGRLRIKIARQVVLCLVLLIIIGVVKSINSTVTNYLEEQVRYILTYNIELKNVFSQVDNLAVRVRDSIFPGNRDVTAPGDAVTSPGDAATDESQSSSAAPTSTETQSSSTAPTSTETLSSSTAPTSTGSPAAEDAAGNVGKGGSDMEREVEKADENNGLAGGDNSGAGESVGAESAVLAASSEHISSNSYESADSTNKTAVKEEYTYTSASGMILPVDGTLGSLFGEETGSSAVEGKIHEGIDINTVKGSSVKAVLDGTVGATGASPAYGNYVRISHPDGLETVYAYCSEVLVREGQSVKKGDIIARIGNADITAGSHLHFEVWKAGDAVDPLEYIPVPVE